MDFAHFDGETLLILIDDYSRFPFIEPVTSEAACAVIPKIDKRARVQALQSDTAMAQS